MKQFERKVMRVGDSFGITLPKELLKQVGLAHGDHVQVEIKNGKIVLSKKESITISEGANPDFTDILNMMS